MKPFKNIEYNKYNNNLKQTNKMENQETINSTDHLVDYVMDFYGGNEPLWDFFKESPITKTEIQSAVNVHRSVICPVKWNHNGYCDSFDREMVRDIMFIQKGMTTNIKEQLEYGNFMLRFYTPKGRLKKKYASMVTEIAEW
tara:strand:- start:599 stop:1021 length:423 start_codon:yes stop_codon:yes gene_type:complete